MTRFANLEYDGEHEREEVHSSLRESKPEVRDEQYYLRVAEGEYQVAHFEQALRYYSRALEFNPNVEAAWVGQVRMLIEMGELKEAGVWAEKGLEVFRNSPELLAARGVVASRLGDRKKALEFSDSATSARGGATPYVWLARGEVLLATRGKNGHFCLEKARTVAGARDWFTCLLVARIYYLYRYYAQAMEHARMALDQKATSPFVWFTLGNTQQALGMNRKAKESYRQALQLDPGFSPAKAALEGLDGLGFLKRLFAPLRRLYA